jgi:hypothetical protein
MATTQRQEKKNELEKEKPPEGYYEEKDK